LSLSSSLGANGSSPDTSVVARETPTMGSEAHTTVHDFTDLHPQTHQEMRSPLPELEEGNLFLKALM
jgi:hypothetical protein